MNWTQASIVTLIVASIIAVLCAWECYHIFYRWRNTITAKAKITGYILIAISLGFFSIIVRLIQEAPLDVRQFVSFVGILLFAFGLVCLYIALLDLRSFLDIGKSITERIKDAIRRR